MTNEQAKSELMQIYMSLSEEKKQALDVLMAQADGEKTCGTCRNEDTYHCADCENKSDYEQAQADGEYIKKSDMIDWLKDIRHKMKPQNYHTASEFEIAENQIWNLIQMLQMGAFPTVVIPSAEPKTEQFAKWVATEIFDEWEYNKDAFAEIACRKLEKLGIVRAKGDEWELVEPTCDTCRYTTAAFNPCNACKDKSEYKPQESEEV